MLVAIREDPQRAELLGYDVRKYQLATFVHRQRAGGLERRPLHAHGASSFAPSSMGLPAAAMPIIWVASAGRQDLTATVVGTFLLLLMFQTITVYSQQYALILMGLLLLLHGAAARRRLRVIGIVPLAPRRVAGAARRLVAMTAHIWRPARSTSTSAASRRSRT